MGYNQWKVASLFGFRYLRSKVKPKLPSLTTTLCSLGLIISVATLIIVMSVMNGFRKEMIEKILGINSHISMHIKNSEEYDSVIKKVKTIEGIKEVNPILDGQGMVINNKNNTSTGAMIRGITKEYLNKKNIITQGLIHDDKADQFTGNKIIIGSEMARKLDLSTGDIITLVIPQGNTTILGFIPHHKSYKISGIFNVGMQQYNDGIIFMPLETAQFLYDTGKKISSIEIITDNPNKINLIKQKIQNKISTSMTLIDWEEENQPLMHALEVESSVMFLILSLFVIIATFMMFGNLIMLVNDKQKNIAILRSMGMSKKSIAGIFIITGLTLSTIGITIGAILGIILANNIESIRIFLEKTFDTKLLDGTIYFLSNLPAQVENRDVFVVCIMSLIFAILATIIPARKAASFNAANALKYF